MLLSQIRDLLLKNEKYLLIKMSFIDVFFLTIPVSTIKDVLETKPKKNFTILLASDQTGRTTLGQLATKQVVC